MQSWDAAPDGQEVLLEQTDSGAGQEVLCLQLSASSDSMSSSKPAEGPHLKVVMHRLHHLQEQHVEHCQHTGEGSGYKLAKEKPRLGVMVEDISLNLSPSELLELSLFTYLLLA